MERMAFLMEMVDKISGPAKSAVGALADVKSALRGLSAAVAIPAVADLGRMGAALAGKVLSLAKSGAEMALDAMEFQQSTKAAFVAIEGSQAKGERLYKHILDMAQTFRESPKDMMASVSALRRAGLSTEEALSIMQSSLDLKKLVPAAKIDELAKTFGKIKAQGTFGAEGLNQLAESAGLSRDAVYQAVIQMRGLSATDPKSLETVKQLFHDNKIKAEEAIPAIQRAVMAMTGTQKAGEYAEKSKNSVASLINGLKNAPEQFLLRMSVDDGPLQKLLLKLNELFDPASESGKRFADLLNRVGAQVMQIFEKMGTPGNAAKFEKFIVNLIKLIPALVALFAGMLDVFIFLTDVFASLGDNCSFLWNEIKNLWRESWVLQGALAAIVLIMSPLIVMTGIVAAAVALMMSPFILVGYVAYKAISGIWTLITDFWTWLKNSSIGEAFSAIFSGALGVLNDIYKTVTGITDKIGGVIKSAGSKISSMASSAWSSVKGVFSGPSAVPMADTGVAPDGAGMPMTAADFTSNKTANIQIGDISVKSINGDNPTTQTVAGDVGAAVRRELTMALRQANGELG
jgi:hypothetical protein